MSKNFLIRNIVFGTLFLLASFVNVSAISNSEVHITKDGRASITSAKVMQLAGSTFFTRLYWGESYIRFLIKTNNNTKFFRGTGEATTLSEVSVGDILDVSGVLESGSESLVLVAATVKNSSVQKQQMELSGKVASVDLSARKFTLNSPKFGLVTVATSAGTQFVKGSRTLDLEHIVEGDLITKTSGEYDFNTKTLTANFIVTYVNLNYYRPKNFEGTLQSIIGTTLPTSIKMMIGNTVYTVNLPAEASVMSKNRKSASLNRFVSGDTVRIYGSIREIDEPEISASIVRNMSL